MIAKLGQGPSNMLQMQATCTNDNDIVSPSFLVSPGGQSPSFSHMTHRRSSASSIIDDVSLDSDSDEESGMALMTLNPRIRSDSVQTSGSSTQSSEMKAKETEAEEVEGLARRQSDTDLIIADEEKAQVGAMSRTRSESLGKISRSSSAPQNERPRVVDSNSLSRSSSAPQGSPEQVSSLREGIIVKRRVDEQEGSVSSSSVSLNDSAGDSDMPSPSSSQNAPIDFPSLPPPEGNTGTEVHSTDQQPNSELESSTEQDTHQLSSSCDETVSSPVGDNECETNQELDDNSLDGSEEDLSLTVESKGNLAVPQLGQTPGFQALQNLSDSLESTLKGNESVKQTPHIKSQLIAQHKIESAISQPEPPQVRSQIFHFFFKFFEKLKFL